MVQENEISVRSKVCWKKRIRLRQKLAACDWEITNSSLPKKGVLTVYMLTRNMLEGVSDIF